VIQATLLDITACHPELVEGYAPWAKRVCRQMSINENKNRKDYFVVYIKKTREICYF
jgi:hypothetical protein